MKNNKLKNPRLYIAIALTIYFIFLMAMVPYSHDDWQWGCQIKWQLMLDGFKNYNGRYLGNLLEIFITRSILAKNIILGIGITTIIYVAYSFVKKDVNEDRKTSLLLLTAILLLAIPRELFRQTYSWIAAYINFIPPVILIIIYLNIVNDVFNDDNFGKKRIKDSTFMILIMIPLGISTQLFSEHTTVFVVLLATFIVLYSFKKYNTFTKFQVSYLISVILGAIIMFTNGSYFNAANNTDGYKEISLSIRGIMKIYVLQISDNLFLNNYLLNIILGSVCLIIIIKYFRENVKYSFVGKLQMFIISSYMAYGLINKIYPMWNILTNEKLKIIFNAGYSLIYFACIISIIFMYIDKEGLRMKIIMLYGSSLAVAMPLVVANPIGPRCFYASYVFIVITALQLIEYTIDRGICTDMIISAESGILIMICIFYMVIFINVGAADKIREETINNAVDKNESCIELNRLPYEDYFWTTVPPDDYWASYFKEFYKIPQDTKVLFK